MSDNLHKSAGISPRRALLEEVLERRSRIVAGLPVDGDEPPSSSSLWSFGAMRLAGAARFNRGADQRSLILDLAVVALAWLERFDADAQPEADSDALGAHE